MSKTNTDDKHPKSKAVIAVDVQNNNRSITEGIRDLCARAESLVESQVPTKRMRKSLLDSAETLLFTTKREC